MPEWVVQIAQYLGGPAGVGVVSVYVIKNLFELLGTKLERIATAVEKLSALADRGEP